MNKCLELEKNIQLLDEFNKFCKGFIKDYKKNNQKAIEIKENSMGLNAQGYIEEPDGGIPEHDDDDLLPDREDLDDKADRLYDEQEINMEDDKC